MMKTTSRSPNRVTVQGVTPQVDCGRHPAKGILGDLIQVGCDLIADGHDAVAGAVLVRAPDNAEWKAIDLVAGVNDRYEGGFLADRLGEWEYTVEGWIDAFATWRSGVTKKLSAGQDVANELLVGARLFSEAAERASGSDRSLFAEAAHTAAGQREASVRVAASTSEALVAAMRRHPDRRSATRSEPPLKLIVEPERARFSAWYEMFPRSSGAPGKHGTLRDCAARLPYVASMGFDVLYLPPIHPIGRSYRKGPNNSLQASAADVGSPWAIGSAEGGHKAIHPELGTLADFRALVADAAALGIALAIDIAFQASPDHPYVKDHPEWFRKRPDGTIQYAENPPKKYQDVYPFDFECEAWQTLWDELASIIVFWCEQGVRVFRVDNPHTKSIGFWDWCIRHVKARYAEAIFLAEAFTRPKLMYALAMAGFTQSYTYFTWRHTAREFTEYMTELSAPPVSQFFRPNFWTNTPDILPEHLQFGGRPTFVQRLILAATLSSNYGIYGPPFELMEHVARPDSEEYVDNEKYQIRTWDLDRDESLRDVIALVNRIRRGNRALQANRVTFHPCDNQNLLCFSKRSADDSETVLVVVNMDAHHTHSGAIDLNLRALGVGSEEAYQAHDLLSDARYEWRGSKPYVELDPQIMPASIFRIRRRVLREHDFEYYL